jgi:hypothetical protein
MREDAMLYNITLARSLGYVADNGVAWNNSWGFAPTDENIAYYTRVMAMSRIGWLAHLYGNSACFGPGYPNHPTWEKIQTATERLRKANELLGNARPSADIAMLYTWEGCAAGADYDYMHIHRSSDMQAVKKLLLSGHGVDIVGTESLEKAKVSSDESRIEIEGIHYGTLLVPWADMLSPEVWKVLGAFADAGGRLVFWGPPPRQDSTGQPVDEKFSEIVGGTVNEASRWRKQALRAEPLLFSGKACFYDADADEPEFFCQLPHYYPDPRIYAVEVTGGKPFAEFAAHNCTVQNGNVVYFAAEPPLCGSLLVDLLRFLGARPELILPENVIGRKLTDPDKKEVFVALAGRHDEPMEGQADCNGTKINLSGKKFLLARMREEAEEIIYEE